jgi:hypothetical protein
MLLDPVPADTERLARIRAVLQTELDARDRSRPG